MHRPARIRNGWNTSILPGRPDLRPNPRPASGLPARERDNRGHSTLSLFYLSAPGDHGNGRGGKGGNNDEAFRLPYSLGQSQLNRNTNPAELTADQNGNGEDKPLRSQPQAPLLWRDRSGNACNNESKAGARNLNPIGAPQPQPQTHSLHAQDQGIATCDQVEMPSQSKAAGLACGP